MIDVPELDIFIKSIYYALNCNTPIYKDILTKEAQTYCSYVASQQGTIMRFKEIVEQSGFSFTIARCNSMYGVCELKGLYDPFLILSAPFLKIYPRLLYSNGFIKDTPDFEKYEYFFRYYPKMVVRQYLKDGDNKTKFAPSTHWILGTHNKLADGKTIISYNVAVNVNLHTIVEEELHGQIQDLHGTTNTSKVVKEIETINPNLRKEIEENLNRILSTEEKKFKDLGSIIHIEFASELRSFQSFIDKFENDVIQSTEINLPPDPTIPPPGQNPQAAKPTETPKIN